MRNSDHYGFIVYGLRELALECQTDDQKTCFVLALCDLLKEIDSLIGLPNSTGQLIRHLVALLDPMPEPPSEVPS